ncbi:MAG: F0F1 ATP synthase subunit A [Candidatus Izemoplasmatales bacterium]|nr:F0F1 ATP synthase subunit A [Candidatus Izemoplasmatales bacterium]
MGDFKLIAPLSPNVISTLIVVAVLGMIAVLVGKRVEKLNPAETPKGSMFVFVMMIDFFDRFISDHLPGDRKRVFGPYLFTIFVFLAFANTISLFGLNPPLANLGVALTFSIITLFMIKFAELRYQGLKKKLVGLLGYVKPMAPLMLPINLIGEISTPLTMGMRLFGNLMSGTVISVMVYTALHWFFGIFAGVAIHAVFDIFFGLIQAFVFFMLSTVNIAMASDA